MNQPLSKPVTIGETIEAMIDHSTLAEVLDVIGTICHEKAAHLESNWQDPTSAKHWRDSGNDIARLSARFVNRFGR